MEICKESMIIVFLLLGIMALFAIPDDESATWVFDLIVSKIIAGGCLYVVGALSPIRKEKSKSAKVKPIDKKSRCECL